MNTDHFPTMSALLRSVPPGSNYRFEIDDSRNTAVKIFAPHGGCIEPATEPIALAVARGRFDYFIFSGLRKSDCRRLLHVTSTRYDEPRCIAMAVAAEVCVAIHGSMEAAEIIHVGGGNTRLCAELLGELRRGAFPAVPSAREIAGTDAENLVNRGRQAGIQLELSAGFRRWLYPTFPKLNEMNESEFRKFADLLRGWCSGLETRLRHSEES